jgi:hypothetical protein
MTGSWMKKNRRHQTVIRPAAKENITHGRPSKIMMNVQRYKTKHSIQTVEEEKVVAKRAK